MTTWLPLDGMLAVIAGWLALGVASLAASRRPSVVVRALFPVGGLAGLALAALALGTLASPPAAAQVAVLPIGLPTLPAHLRLDPLSAFFLLVLGAGAAGISVFAAGYFRPDDAGTPAGRLGAWYHLFLASMAGVLLADDAYAFVVSWEAMAMSSYFLVITDHRAAEVRQAGGLYLTMARGGAIAVLLCFGVLHAGGSGAAGDLTFATLRAHAAAPAVAGLSFTLALIGFGAKAGLLPLHVWLPEAHPAAPSPVSALMSGVMLNTALYGLLRVTFDLLHAPPWWWGALLLGTGLATALFGVVHAAVQTDMKRLLAWSSVENMGLLFAGLGLAVVFAAHGMRPMAALALTATLYHVASHACFKSLLFLGTGSVLHATGERRLGRLGGLLRAMPWGGWLTLVGALAAAGLPPLGGFVSEWLLLQSFLFAPALPVPLLTMGVPVVAALIALVAALAGYTMVKFFGVIFLGQPREPRLAPGQLHDAGWPARAAMLWFAAGCIALGLLPTVVIRLIAPVTRQLVQAGPAPGAADGGWLLVPVGATQASYGPVVFLLGIAGTCALVVLGVRLAYHARLRRAPAWACGFPWGTARMQDTAEGFGQPIRQIFEPFFAMRRELPAPVDDAPRYRVVVEDPFWQRAYQPLIDAVAAVARAAGRFQQGRIAACLLASFVTLVATLVVVTA